MSCPSAAAETTAAGGTAIKPGSVPVPFGFWQMAYGSKQTLDATNYATARAAMMGMKGNYDRPLGITPNLLVVPPALEGAANRLMKNEQINGSDNEWKGTAEVLVVPERSPERWRDDDFRDRRRPGAGRCHAGTRENHLRWSRGRGHPCAGQLPRPRS